MGAPPVVCDVAALIQATATITLRFVCIVIDRNWQYLEPVGARSPWSIIRPLPCLV